MLPSRNRLLLSSHPSRLLLTWTVIIGDGVLADNTFCSYDKGMFSAEEWAQTSGLETAFEFEAACFHEAGHAVIGYLLGQGCSSVSVAVSYVYDFAGRPTGVGYGGMARESRAFIRKVNKDLAVGRFTGVLARYGISVAAGPAAERKFRIETEMPLRLLGATEGDHRQINTVSKILEAHGRSSFAYKRLVWRAAQRLMAVPNIWSCVSHLAGELYERADFREDKDAIYTVSGRTARAIMKRWQVTPTHAASLLAASTTSGSPDLGDTSIVATDPPASSSAQS